MKVLRFLVLVPVWFLVVAASFTPSSDSPTPPGASPTPTPTPTPTPIPINANIVLDSAAGGPSTKITVTGSMFLAHEAINIYWDSPNRVAASVTTDGSGNFSTVVTPIAGDGLGAHVICASVPPKPCAFFSLQGPPSPTPAQSSSPSPSSSPSTSPSASASPSTSPTPLSLTANTDGRGGLDVITRPPLVFLPLIGLLGLLAALAYWVLMKVDRDRPPVLPSATIIHRSARPDLAPMHSRTPLPGDPPLPPPAEPRPAPPTAPEQPPY